MNLPGRGQLGLGFVPKVKAPPARENQIELAICHFLRISGHCFWKQPSRGYFDVKRKAFRRDSNPYVGRGVPDIIVIFHGLFVGLEVKSPTGKQSDDQKEFERKITRAGGFYHVVRSVEDVQIVLNALQKSFQEDDEELE
jgi:hypothetical protein